LVINNLIINNIKINMRTITALIAGVSAVHVDQAATPDVYGPNGANYTNVSPSQDMARIKIDITTKGDGKGDKNEVCKDGQWAKISYKGYLKDGRQILDTAEDGQDKIFAVGASQTFKCLDLAITQMKAGAKAHVECPSDLVYGGASV
jgi:FKBP-type peptidyl-prolyl cis-trans isomerase